MRFTKKKIAAVVATTAVVALGAGAAFAYWTSVGDGVGSGSTGTAGVWDITSTAVTTNTLSPDGPTQTITFSVQNDGTGVQRLAAVTAAVAGPLGIPWVSSPVGCTLLDFAVGTPNITYGDVAAGATVNGSVTLQMIDTSLNQDVCKNKTVPLYLHAS